MTTRTRGETLARARTPSADRTLIIVARDAPDLYAHLAYAFEGSDTVDVITDRRHQRLSAPALRTDRRSLAIDAALRTLGWAVVRRPLETCRTRPRARRAATSS